MLCIVIALQCSAVLYGCTLVWPRDIFLAWIKYQRNIGFNIKRILWHWLFTHSILLFECFELSFQWWEDALYRIHSVSFWFHTWANYVTTCKHFLKPMSAFRQSLRMLGKVHLNDVHYKTSAKVFFFLLSKPANFRVKFNQFLNGLPLSFCHLCCILCAGFLKYS